MLFPVLSDWFDNDFSDGLMNGVVRRANATAPAVNVKEDNEKYTMEVAVPVSRKSTYASALMPTAILSLPLRTSLSTRRKSTRRRSTRSTICAASSLTATTSRPTRCPRMLTRATSRLRWLMAS